MCAWGQAAAAIGSSLAAGLGSYLGNKKTAAHGFTSAGGADLVGNIQKIGSPSNFDWSKLGDLFKGIQANLGDYAASAFDYYMADKAFNDQVNYNKDMMAMQYGYDTKASKYNAQLSNWLQGQQNSWSEMMSNTSHQREVADLRAAGLNPILSSNAGANGYSSGGAVVSGAAPQALGVDQPNYASAAQTRVARQEMRIREKLSNSQASLMASQALQAIAEVGFKKAQQDRLDAQTGNDFLHAMMDMKKNNAEVAEINSRASKQNFELMSVLPEMIHNYRAQAGSHNAHSALDKAMRGYYGHLDMLLGDNKSNTEGQHLRIGPVDFGYNRTEQRY